MIDDAAAENITINISDIQGVNINQTKMQIHRGINMIDIDISKLISGAYVYSIIVDKIFIDSGKFNIIK